jgi:hypothetical protein
MTGDPESAPASGPATGRRDGYAPIGFGECRARVVA